MVLFAEHPYSDSALVASWWSDAAGCRNMKMQLSDQF